MRTRPLITFLSILIVACETVVDVDIPLSGQHLTLNSFFNPDSTWSARLYLSRHILDDAPFPSVEGAVVVIYENDVPVDTLQNTGEGLYKAATTKPEPGKTYEIRASFPQLGTVSSQSLVPEGVTINDVTLAIPENGNGADMAVKLTFKDRPMEINYYQVKMEIERTFKHPQTGDTIVDRYPAYIYSDDPAIDNDNSFISGGTGIFIRDILFDGKETTIQFRSGVWAINDDDKIFIYLRTLSEDFYRYQTTLSLQQHTSDDPFAQPASVYNNIENGFGIFAGYSEDRFVYQK